MGRLPLVLQHSTLPKIERPHLASGRPGPVRICVSFDSARQLRPEAWPFVVADADISSFLLSGLLLLTPYAHLVHAKAVATFERHARKLVEQYGQGIEPGKGDLLVAVKMAHDGWTATQVIEGVRVAEVRKTVLQGVEMQAYARKVSQQAAHSSSLAREQSSLRHDRGAERSPVGPLASRALRSLSGTDLWTWQVPAAQ